MANEAAMQKLEALRRELVTQDEEWQRAKEALTRLGCVEIAVPREFLEAMDGLTNHSPPSHCVRG